MVRIFILDKRARETGEEAERKARKTLRALGLRKKVVDIYIVSSVQSQKLNKKYRGIDTPASVLSFSEGEGWPHPEERGRRRLGEIYLASAYLKRKGYSVQLLIIHGILHLLGFDHQNKKEARRMEREEERVRELIN